MPDFESLPPGTFCWPELATTDQQGSVAYYRGLFGWEVTDQPIGPTETYSMFQLRGRNVAAAYSMRAEERQHGVPPHWNSYVSVASADEAVKQAEALGATVIMQPFDVMDAGRMAFLKDPTGATFAVWQPKRHIGTQIQSESGALCWTELSTRDTKAAEKFYTQLFGWIPKHSAPGSGMDYTEFSIQGRPAVGMMPMPEAVPSQVPAFWLPYFQVTDVDATSAKSKQLGGKVTVPPTDIPNTGRFAILNDPSGAMFAIYTPARKET